jgi:hypothetical protein
MAIKVILVPMNASAACEAALATAFALARQLHAHVSALMSRRCMSVPIRATPCPIWAKACPAS